MSERGAQRSGINRAFSWIKRTLEITQPTDAPDRVSPLVQPTMDLFGWERLSRLDSVVLAGGDNQDFILGPVSVGYTLVVEASISQDDPLNIHIFWFEHRHLNVSSPAISVPFVVPVVALVDVRVGLDKWLLLSPGERIVGRCTVAPSVGSAMQMQLATTEITEGEYVAALS